MSPSSLVELQRGSAFESPYIYRSWWMWIWDPFYGTMIFWIGWHGFHLDLCEEVMGNNIRIIHDALTPVSLSGKWFYGIQ